MAPVSWVCEIEKCKNDKVESLVMNGRGQGDILIKVSYTLFGKQNWHAIEQF